MTIDEVFEEIKSAFDRAEKGKKNAELLAQIIKYMPQLDNIDAKLFSEKLNRRKSAGTDFLMMKRLFIRIGRKNINLDGI